MITLSLIDPSTGDEIATIDFRDHRSRRHGRSRGDLAGAVLGTSWPWRSRAARPAATPPTAWPRAGMVVLVEMRDLVVDAATAVIEEQSFHHADLITLPTI